MINYWANYQENIFYFFSQLLLFESLLILYPLRDLTVPCEASIKKKILSEERNYRNFVTHGNESFGFYGCGRTDIFLAASYIRLLSFLIPYLFTIASCNAFYLNKLSPPTSTNGNQTLVPTCNLFYSFLSFQHVCVRRDCYNRYYCNGGERLPPSIPRKRILPEPRSNCYSCRTW